MLRVSLALIFVMVMLAGCGNDSAPPATDGSVNLDAATPGSCTQNADCDDRLPCTVDRCDLSTGIGRCGHQVDPSRCMGGQTCDPRLGCVAGRVCTGDADCVESNRCRVNQRCDLASRVCIYDLFDGDEDGEPSRACGGNDCNDADPQISPRLPERCNGMDDNCNGQVDESHEDCGRGTECRGGACACIINGRTEDFRRGRLQFCPGPGGSRICTDVRTDNEACGELCAQCETGTRCVMGVCSR